MGDTTEQILKPCPFCGSTDVGGAGGIVHCYRCPAKIEVQNTNTFYAGELWNRRAHSDSLQSELNNMFQQLNEANVLLGEKTEKCVYLQSQLDEAKSELSDAIAECRKFHNGCSDLDRELEAMRGQLNKWQDQHIKTVAALEIAWQALPEGEADRIFRLTADSGVCLAEIEARAIERFMDEVFATLRHSSSEDIHWRSLREQKESFLLQLRQQAKDRIKTATCVACKAKYTGSMEDIQNLKKCSCGNDSFGIKDADPADVILRVWEGPRATKEVTKDES